MNNELWEHCEHLAKSGRIVLVTDELYNEVRSRLTESVDPDVDIRDLITSAYDPDASYTLQSFVTVLVDVLNYPGVKAKRPK